MDKPWQQSISNTLSIEIGLGVPRFIEEIHYSSQHGKISESFDYPRCKLLFFWLHLWHTSHYKQLHWLHRWNPRSKCICYKIWAELILPSALVNLTDSLEISPGQQTIQQHFWAGHRPFLLPMAEPKAPGWRRAAAHKGTVQKRNTISFSIFTREKDMHTHEIHRGKKNAQRLVL